MAEAEGARAVAAAWEPEIGGEQRACDETAKGAGDPDSSAGRRRDGRPGRGEAMGPATHMGREGE